MSAFAESDNICLSLSSLIMKNSYYLTIALCLFSFSLFAQNDTIWFDTNWKQTTKNNAAFFRAESAKKGNGFWFEDYYISGVKQMEGLSFKKETEVFDGTVKWYYENGKPSQVVNYKNGILDGNRKIYYENGKLKSESNYNKSKRDGVYIEYYDNGKLKETGKYTNGLKKGVWKTYYTDGKIASEGNYKNGKKVNVWKDYHYDGSELYQR
jgi:hypothetical protein